MQAFICANGQQPYPMVHDNIKMSDEVLFSRSENSYAGHGLLASPQKGPLERE